MKLSNTKVNWKAIPTKREKIIFGVVLLLVIFAFFKSCNSSSKVIDMVKGDLKSALSEQRTLSKSLKEVRRRAVQKKAGFGASQEFEEWAGKIMESPEVFIMKEFTDPIILKDLKMKAINFENATRDVNVIQQPFSIIVGGSFLSMLEYLERLYELPLLLVVDSVDINLDNKVSGRVNAEVKGMVYGWN